MQKIHKSILAINDEQSAAYVADEAARRRHWAKHTTYFACIKCMDGRVDFPSMTNTPLGLVKPFRAIGGKFEVFWPSFLGRMHAWINSAMAHGSRSCVLVTYHYSASDTHLGCAGWKYDTASARAHAEKLRNELAYVFGEQLTAIVAGIETDVDIFTLHGDKGDVSGNTLQGKSENDIRAAIVSAFTNMPDDVVRDLIPFLKGNAEHISDLIAHPRAHEEKGHNERVVAVGQGFDWLAKLNYALVINDSDPNLDESVRVAISIIVKNLADAAKGDEAT